MKKKVSKGFTLVEVLVCLALIAIISTIFFTAINISTKSNKKSQVDSIALTLAQSELENIRLQIKNNESSIKTLDNKNIVIGKLNKFTSNDYNFEILIQEKSDLLYEVKVSLKYKNNDFSTRNTEIITQVAKNTNI